jgi:hypothetical protein
MRQRHYLIPLILCFGAGCQEDGAKGNVTAPSAKSDILQTKATATKEDSGTAGVGKIDPDPIPTDKAIIVAKKDIKVSGQPACDFVIRYPNRIDQNVTWTGEGCNVISARFITVDELSRASQLDDLSGEAKEDINRSPGKSVFYIESEFTASVFPLNAAGVIYEVPIAD